jgi:hypothetical protein
MATLFQVGVTAGVPGSGTGDASTIDSLLRFRTVAVTTLTRPNTVTAYAALDSISNNTTAASVTALSAAISDTADHPVEIFSMLLHSTDTGLAGTNVRAYLYRADPTASSGVVGGDNAAFSNKKNECIGTMTGQMKAGFSDGSVGRLVPESGQPIIALPTTGAQTIFVQYQTIDGFTPSAVSTTLIGTICARQGRA